MERLRKKKPSTKTDNENTSFFPPVQAKLAVGQKDDAYEKEADQVADKVVSNTSEKSAVQKMGEEEQVQQKPLIGSISSVQKLEDPKNDGQVQKQEEEETVQTQPVEEEEEMLQTQPVEEEEEMLQPQAEEDPEEEENIQPKAETSSKVKPNTESKLKNSSSAGSKMDPQTMQQMQEGFGTDFSNVNIHTGAEAQEMSKDLGAQAFTHGQDVYFNEGKYDPSSKEGKHLLAHELTHTIQQEKQINKKEKPKS